MTEAPLSEWDGIRTDPANGRVLRLELSDNNLSGEIPPELDHLDQLERLDLANNELTGSLPARLLNLEGLQQLCLQDNGLTGQIPERSTGMSDIEEIGLCNNQLEGSIPKWLGLCRNLGGVWMSGCGLSGEIPPELVQARDLVHLDLANNSLTGQIPAALGELDRLRTLLLEGNLFSGGIPQALWNVRNHDLVQVASDIGHEVTGHLLDFHTGPGGHDGWVSIETCPGWPPRTLRLRLREGRLLRDRQRGELVGILWTNLDGELWAENIWVDCKIQPRAMRTERTCRKTRPQPSSSKAGWTRPER